MRSDAGFATRVVLAALATIVALGAAAGRPALGQGPAEPVDFVRDARPILARRCYSCHGEQKQKSGLRLDVKAAALRGGELYGPSIVAGRSQESPLARFVADENADLQMPPDERLPAAEIDVLTRWIDAGAPWPDGVDRVALADPRAHWSFQPLAAVAPPPTRDAEWPRGAIDRFILAGLEARGLRPAQEADRVAWLRRVCFDLVGLPPTPGQTAAFVADPRPDAHARVVDELLASPRHGERWAQHWLDVARYADTHGFEVNTERPNAWPYRDHVIEAFNRDTPFDEFARRQIVGDALGEDVATGFLVTASVLLPGQIGADDASKRLARQDALDEIVVNIGQTFLGLSIGCARCHDHKFDPISQREYYAMQAFVAGVEYEERARRDPAALALRAEAERRQARVAEIDLALVGLTPRANSGVVRPMVNARHNVERFAPVKAKRVRFTIRSTNNREPCLDELEVFNTRGENVALASAGARAEASGSNTEPNRHELKHIHDGQYGNSRSWMSNETGKGWVLIEFAEEHALERVVWGRDREGVFRDRLALDYALEAAPADGPWRTLADASDRRAFDPAGDAGADPGADPDLAGRDVAAWQAAGLSAEEAKQAAALAAERRALAAAQRDAPSRMVFAGAFRAPDAIRLLARGDPERPKELVLPAVPAVLRWEPRPANASTGDTPSTTHPPSTTHTLSSADRAFAAMSPADLPEQERRRALADWLASPRHPLTARVAVNRVWQGHFGAGLVETVNDFGRSGAKPSHPELLDWLAGEFTRSGWSLKHLHRLIVLSATYRQSTRFDAAAAERDADARWLWRFPPRRLDAETLRDAMLAVSGELDSRMGGPGFNLFSQRGGLTGFTPVESFPPDGLRRMIYAHKVRRERDAVFGAFDCPDGGQSAGRRRESTTPLQALNLFNSRFTLERSAALAARARSEAGDDAEAGIRRAFWLAWSREPTADELAEARAAVTAHGLPVLCRALFNANEFLYWP